MIEKCKDKDLIESMLLEMAGEFPGFAEVFINERDQYLAYNIERFSGMVKSAGECLYNLFRLPKTLFIQDVIFVLNHNRKEVNNS